MDCPLNWAHQQDRKAEAFVNHCKFAEAIVCHQRAAEFLQQAMRMTKVQQALISMRLQFENHCRQQKIVKDKWKRCKIQQEKVIQERAQMLHLQERQNQESNEKEPPKNVIVNDREDVEDNKRETECSQSSSLVISAENFSVSSTSSSSDCNASKDKKVIKELETQVNELQMQVLSLSQDLEDCNRENSRLKKALDTVHKFVRCKFGYDLNNQFEAGESGIELETYEY